MPARKWIHRFGAAPALALALALGGCLNLAGNDAKAKPEEERLGAVSAIFNSNCMNLAWSDLGECNRQTTERWTGCVNTTYRSANPDDARHNELYPECRDDDPDYPLCPACCERRRLRDEQQCDAFERQDFQWCNDVYQINMGNCRTRM